MKSLILFIALVGFFGLEQSYAQKCKIKYTGIYKADLNEEEAIYLRFFKDGTVLHTSSITDEKKAYKFIIQTFSDQMLSGKYYQRGCAFSADVKNGKIKMSVKGAVQGDIILATMKDKISGETLDKQFEYYEMEDLEE